METSRSIESILKEKVAASKDGMITYREYIETVLYSPEHGYYMKEREKIGKNGDFYTSSIMSDGFGIALAKWFSYSLKETGLHPVIAEIGGGTGNLAYSILSYLKENDRELFSRLNYIVVDSSPYHQKRQREKLKSFENAVYAESFSELEDFEGIMFSNELFDALPVSVVEKKQGVLHEVCLELKNGFLSECLRPCINPGLLRYLKNQDIILAEGQRMEIPLDMVACLKSLSQILKKGLLLTIDYGYTHDEWEENIHSKGSLRGYYKHTMVSNVLERPGEMDITSHIHFDALKSFGAQYGLRNETVLSQHEFLLRCGLLEEVADHQNTDPFSAVSKRNRSIRSLLLPGGISSYFRALIQTKNMPHLDRLFPY
ncbi:class I SAM-dependent methyltransferase [Peribacillus sp. B-H-3]|uniref:class I SAM-dependent methyltransferase n=1 Tax=Peribacillus sp. B-H-3 TaxID=3400420 RepID=UPI003B02461C